VFVDRLRGIDCREVDEVGEEGALGEEAPELGCGIAGCVVLHAIPVVVAAPIRAR
jgi:hypothetical protein